MKKRIINNEKAVSDSDDTFSDPCSSCSEYKVTGFQRKIHVLSNELSESEMTSLDYNLYYVSGRDVDCKLEELGTGTINKKMLEESVVGLDTSNI